MRLSEFQEQWRVIREKLEESGHLVKSEDWQEDSPGDTKETTTDSKATKDIIDIGVIFTRGRNRGD